MPTPVMPAWTRHILLGLLLVAATWCVYAQALAFEFVSWDDPHYITENPHVITGLTAENIRWAWTTSHASNWHPLTWLSLMLDAEVFGREPAGFHFTSVMLHTLATLLLYAWLAQFTGRAWCAAVVAGLFAVHPLRVESVAWVTERKDVLSGVFAWATLWAYGHYTHRRTIARYLAVAALLTAGLLAKPVLVTWPAVTLLLDWGGGKGPSDRATERPRGEEIPARLAATRSGAGGGKRPRDQATEGPRTEQMPPRLAATRSGARPMWLVVEKLPLFALAAISATLTYLAQRAGGSVTTEAIGTFPQRLANAVVAWAAYLGKTVWPSNLSFHYPHPYMPGGEGLSASSIIASAALLLTITALVIFLRKRRYLVVGWLWFLGVLVPNIGLLQAGEQAMADRYTYLPAVGIYIMLVFGCADALGALVRPSRAHRAIAVGTAAVVLAALGLIAHRQARVWRDSRSLYEHALRIDPDHVIAHVNLGLIERKAGRYDKAVAHYETALARNPQHARAQLNMGIALEQLGRMSHAMDAYRAASELDPSSIEARYHLGKALAATGQVDAAADVLRDAVSLAPHPAAPGDLLVLDLHYTLGLVHMHQGDAARAAEHLRTALNIAGDKAVDRALAARLGVDLARALLELPDRHDELAAAVHAALEADADGAEAVFTLGNGLARAGRFEAAAAVYGALADVKPDDAQALNNLGNALAELGRWTPALRAYERAAAARPGWLPPLHGIARISATHPDPAMRAPRRAIELAERICAASARAEARHLDTLAAAYAADGRFVDAAQTASEALTQAQAAGRQHLADGIARRLALYQQGQAFVEPAR